MRIALLVALALVATTFAVTATPVAAASTCAPGEIQQAVCAVVAIPVDAVNFACVKQFGHPCLVFG